MPQKKQQKLSVSNVLLVDGLGYNDRCKLGNLVFNKTNEYINTYRNQLYQDRQMNGQIERLEIDRSRYRYKTKKHCFSI